MQAAFRGNPRTYVAISGALWLAVSGWHWLVGSDWLAMGVLLELIWWLNLSIRSGGQHIVLSLYLFRFWTRYGGNIIEIVVSITVPVTEETKMKFASSQTWLG